MKDSFELITNSVLNAPQTYTRVVACGVGGKAFALNENYLLEKKNPNKTKMLRESIDLIMFEGPVDQETHI